jgi:cytoskeletal protein RodZ
MNLGEVLRSARESAGISLDQLASMTSIRAGLLGEMEKNNFTHCGGDIYAKGHLRNIAPLIGLDAVQVIDLFNEEHSSAARSINELLVENSVAKVPHERKSISWKVPASISLAVVLVFAVVQIVVTNVKSGEIRTPSASASASPSPEATSPETTAPAVVETTTVPAAGKVTLQLVASRGSSRIDIVVDGTHVEKGSIFQGETKSFEGTRSISVYFSNPAGLDVTVNGELLAPLGGQNQEVRRTFR